MSYTFPLENLELRSTLKANGELELSLLPKQIAAPQGDEILVRIEAAPINPSDLGTLLGPADMSTSRLSGTAERPVLTAKVPEQAMPHLTARIDQPLTVGGEGAGVVIAAGETPEAQALLGKSVAMAGGAMYTQYRMLKTAQVLVLPDGVPAAAGGSSFVNPMTVLGMTETMRMEGHTGLVHTAAASNLGQMLVKHCLNEGIPLVNIVRSQEQLELLRGLGAQYICDSSADGFSEQLVTALTETGATLGFDAIGGGKLAGQILQAMETAAGNKAGAAYSLYGSSVQKQVYIYGSLDMRPTELVRSFGFAWKLGGWLLTHFLAKLTPVRFAELRARVAAEITTTFASHYTQEISLTEALQPEIAAAYSKRATGEKYLINPHKA